MAKASLNSSDILAMNDKIGTFVLISADSTDEDDVDLFVVAPPPAVRDAAHRAPIEYMTSLCESCRSALEYCSYFCNTSKPDSEDGAEDLPAACLLHAGAKTLQEGSDAECHLCVLVMSDLRTKRLAMQSIDQSNIEMCWRKSETKQPMPGLIHIALTHNGHARSAQNYWNFLKLKLWPCSEFSPSLFGQLASSVSSTSPTLKLHGSTSSEQTQAKAVQWLSRCRANEDGRHAQCNREPGDRLPTRLLDVTHATETSMLRLVVPLDDPDAFASDRQYMTLSHCWGAWGAKELPVLTTTNLGERQTRGLDLSSLPSTFKDALDVAHWFQGE